MGPILQVSSSTIPRTDNDTRAGMETTADQTDSGYVLNGSKTWISNSPVACVRLWKSDAVKLTTRCSQRPLRHMGTVQVGQPRAWLPPRKGMSSSCACETTDGNVQGMKGLEAPAIKNKLALRASLTGSIFMDHVKVSEDALLPKGLGLSAPFSCLNSARFVLLTHTRMMHPSTHS